MYSQVVESVQKGSVEAAVDILILRALDASGKPLFKPSDKIVMLHEVDAEVVLRIVGEMAAFDAEYQSSLTVEAAKKNSKPMAF